MQLINRASKLAMTQSSDTYLALGSFPTLTTPHTDRHIRKLTETKKQPYPTPHHHHQISFKIPF